MLYAMSVIGIGVLFTFYIWFLLSRIHDESKRRKFTMPNTLKGNTNAK